MTKIAADKSRRKIAASIMGRSALRSAAATALLLTAPYLFAAGPQTTTTQLSAPAASRKLEEQDNEPVVDLLSVPLETEVAEAVSALARIGETASGSDPISVANDEDQVAGADESAIELGGEQGHVTLVNSGDLRGGVGINVTTGVMQNDDSHLISESEYAWTSDYTAPLHDADGNRIQEPCSWDPNYNCDVTATYRQLTTTIVTRDLDANQSDAAISIENSGGVDFSGIYGIRAENAAGASITIENTGDITSTEDTSRRVGIYAQTTTGYYRTIDGPNKVVAGDYVVIEGEPGTADDKLLEVITIGQHETTNTRTRPGNDLGSIRIENSGTIDMGVVDVSELEPGQRPYFTESEAITAVGMGGIEIVNNESGTIKVGDFSKGITTVSAGDATISNAGRIEIGNHSYGIYSSGFPPLASYQMAETYVHGGDTTIVNTGDIIGGLTRAEAEASPNHNAFGELQVAAVAGIRATSLGTNRDFYGSWIHAAENAEYYIAELEKLGLDPSVVYVPDMSKFPELRNYTTTIVNDGSIALKDGALGIYGTAVYGELNAINNGTITIGNGRSIFEHNVENHASGIYLNNFTVEGFADLYAKNGETGVIHTGDDGAGIQIQSFRGDAVAVNEGSITTGDGGIGQHYNYVYKEDYDWLFPSAGMSVTTFGMGYAQKASARNSGDITVGSESFGIVAGGNSFAQGALLPFRVTGELVNEGSVTGGANSTGLISSGNNVSITNTGTVTIGSRDLSDFNPDPSPYSASAVNFRLLGHGIYARSDLVGNVQNDGTVTTGDNTVGIFNTQRQPVGGYATYTMQGEDGAVVTGDRSIGVRSRGAYLTVLDNAGSITVGDESTGVDMTAGFAAIRFLSDAEMPALAVVPGSVQAFNTGIIETGDDSVGVNLAGFLADFPYEGKSYYLTSRDPWVGEYRYYEGTVDVPGYALLHNVGTIRVGANSTAVRIAGLGVDGRNLTNAGLIEAGADADSVAVELNVGNDVDSHLVNVGTIVGNIQFGSGDDTLTNTTADNLTGTTGAANIVLQDNRIDFGAGANRLVMDQGALTFFGTDNLITGADLELSYAWFDARNLALGDALTIEGKVAGDFRFGTDLDASGAADTLVISGDVAEGSTIGVMVNPTEQLAGEIRFTPITVTGSNGAETIEFGGASGAFADTVQDAVFEFDQASGQIVGRARIGMGHMATMTAASTTLAQDWWRQSIGTLGQRNLHTLAGDSDSGLSLWGGQLHEEADIDPDAQQDASFGEILTATQFGASWTGELGGGRLSLSPMLSYGDAEATLNANRSSANGDALAYGLNASWAAGNGFHVDATWQALEMDLELHTPQAATNAKGSTEASGQGFNLELGYAHALASGLTFVPQFQYNLVDVDLDDFSSSDGIHSLSGIGGEASTLRAGVTMLRTFETANGSITPLAGLSYVEGIDGESELDSNGVGFATDTSGSGYLAELGVSGRYRSWDIGARFDYRESSVATGDYSLNVTVRWHL